MSKVDDTAVQVTFAVRLRSDAPPCVSASDAQQMIIRGQDHLLLPYRGGGRYEFKSPAAAPGE